jgi:hypothetical protein
LRRAAVVDAVVLREAEAIVVRAVRRAVVISHAQGAIIIPCRLPKC